MADAILRHLDYRDEVIAEFAASERRWIERVADVESDRDSYQLIAKQAIHALSAVMTERDRLRRRVVQLIDEVRRLRSTEFTGESGGPEVRERAA